MISTIVVSVSQLTTLAMVRRYQRRVAGDIDDGGVFLSLCSSPDAIVVQSLAFDFSGSDGFFGPVTS